MNADHGRLARLREMADSKKQLDDMALLQERLRERLQGLEKEEHLHRETVLREREEAEERVKQEKNAFIAKFGAIDEFIREKEAEREALQKEKKTVMYKLNKELSLKRKAEEELSRPAEEPVGVEVHVQPPSSREPTPEVVIDSGKAGGNRSKKQRLSQSGDEKRPQKTEMEEWSDLTAAAKEEVHTARRREMVGVMKMGKDKNLHIIKHKSSAAYHNDHWEGLEHVLPAEKLDTLALPVHEELTVTHHQDQQGLTQVHYTATVESADFNISTFCDQDFMNSLAEPEESA